MGIIVYPDGEAVDQFVAATAPEPPSSNTQARSCVSSKT
jgi:hypothetical protein